MTARTNRKKQGLTVEFDPKQRFDLRITAAHLNVSSSELVRQCVAAHLPEVIKTLEESRSAA